MQGSQSSSWGGSLRCLSSSVLMQSVRDCLLILNWGESVRNTLCIPNTDTVSNAETKQRQFSLSVVRDVEHSSQTLKQYFKLSVTTVT